MRINNSLKNIFIGVISQVIIVILGFITRKIFLDCLGVNYLGVNGLLTNVLSLLALVESGIGTSIIFQLYKPLADKNEPKVIALTQLYKKAYSVLAVVIFILSLLLYPFLGKLMKGDSIPYLAIIYFIFVGKNTVYFLNAHKISLINADQKGYILSTVNLGFQILLSIIKIVVLIMTKSYILFLLLDLGTFIMQNIISGIIVGKRYSFIKSKDKYFLEKKEKESLIKNVKALFLHNIGSYAVFGTDNILISSFIGIISVGLYSNYTMIINQLSSLLSPVLSGLGASIWNLIATEDSEKKYTIFNVTFLVNFWLYSLGVIFLYNILEPFINWWLGESYLLDSFSFIMILANFYLMGMRSSIFTFKNQGGIFVQDKYVPLIGAVINLVTSVVLVNQIGLAGIFMGTTLSTLCVFWVGPFLVYKHIFYVPVWLYFKKFIFYILLNSFACLVTSIFCDLLVYGDDLLTLIERGTICLIIPNAIYFCVFSKTKEFQYLFKIFQIKVVGKMGKLVSKDRAY